jgi:hypothetical protein
MHDSGPEACLLSSGYRRRGTLRGTDRVPLQYAVLYSVRICKTLQYCMPFSKREPRLPNGRLQRAVDTDQPGPAINMLRLHRCELKALIIA